MQDLNTSHVKSTKGGLTGHLLRRLLHFSMILVPIVYYYCGDIITYYLTLTPQLIIIILSAVAIIFEIVRLWFGVRVFGQREHETKQISSFTWAIVSMALVLLFAPGKEYGIPIIACCAIADPIIGELRSLKVNKVLVFIAGMVSVAVIWWLCFWWLNTPWFWAWIMAPVTVAAEWPQLKWIDDNATMQLIPLLLVYFLV